MVLRRDERGVLAIGQQSHAWISGQLARAWGGEGFRRPEPYEEVCLAAEQHDIGMGAWDRRPAFNSSTGLPYSFTEMPLDTHLELWAQGPTRLLNQSRYAALLVSMHGRRLYEMRDLDKMDQAGAARVRHHIDLAAAFQRHLTESLRSEPVTEHAASDAEISRNSDLIWTWDFMSLALCLDWAPCTARAVPSETGPKDIEFTTRQAPEEPAGNEPPLTLVDPWPFAEPTLTVHCDARRLDGPAPDHAAYERQLAEAPWETVTFTLAPTWTAD